MSVKNISKKVTKTFDFPDIVSGEDLCITAVGREHVILENHKELLTYTDKLIRVNASPSAVGVEGNNMSIKYMDSFVIYIDGNIEKIIYEQ